MTSAAFIVVRPFFANQPECKLPGVQIVVRKLRAVFAAGARIALMQVNGFDALERRGRAIPRRIGVLPLICVNARVTQRFIDRSIAKRRRFQ
jgi:hypothetical protein